MYDVHEAVYLLTYLLTIYQTGRHTQKAKTVQGVRLQKNKHT